MRKEMKCERETMMMRIITKFGAMEDKLKIKMSIKTNACFLVLL